MELNGNFYIPKYYCYKCKNVLEPLRITRENYEDDDEEDPSENIGINYCLHIKKDKTVKIVSGNNEEKKLICSWCNCDIFIEDEEDVIEWD